MGEMIVIKLGGVASDNLTPAFFSKMKDWQNEGKRLVIVHGGGHYISQMMARFQLKNETYKGLRVTDNQTLDLTKMVLIGQVQPMITSKFKENNLKAVGMNASFGDFLEGEFVDRKKLGFVGELSQINTELITLLAEKKHIPIIAPLGMTKKGEWLNVNADQAACKIAERLGADKLYLLTDVPGVKYNDEWLSKIDDQLIERLMAEKVIKGGMLPKIGNAQCARDAGVNQVIITNNIENKGTVLV